jgi:hypothetical protein
MSPPDECVIYADPTDPDRKVSLLHMGTDMLVDSESIIIMVGASDILDTYVSPSTSVIKMRSATGKVMFLAGEVRLPFTINDGLGSLSSLCQHSSHQIQYILPGQDV